MQAFTRSEILTIMIPPGTESSLCPSCGVRIFVVDRPSGARMPLELGARGTYAPSSPKAVVPKAGQGVAHLVRCK